MYEPRPHKLSRRWTPWNNCIVWCLWRWFRHGGFVVFTRSKFGWWPHAWWTEDFRSFWTFDPVRLKRRRRWWRVPVLFRGAVVRQEPSRYRGDHLNVGEDLM